MRIGKGVCDEAVRGHVCGQQGRDVDEVKGFEENFIHSLAERIHHGMDVKKFTKVRVMLRRERGFGFICDGVIKIVRDAIFGRCRGRSAVLEPALDEFFTRPDVDVWSRERGRIEAIFFEDLLYVEGRTMKARGLRILAFGRTPRRFRIASWLDRGRGGGMDDFFCARGFGGCEIEIGRGEIDDCICMRGLDGIV